MPHSSDVGSINHLEDSIIVLSSSETMRKRQVVVRRSLNQDSSSSPTTTTSSFTLRTVRYLECQKNHAAAVGGYAVDGCREFMATGEEGTTDALTCAACGCHRNFHRREVDAEVACESCSSPQQN